MKALRKPVSSLVKQVSLGIAASTLAVAASATPIASFDFTQEFEFTEFSPDPGVTEVGGVDPGNVAGSTQLQWGNPVSGGGGRQSSLVINEGDARDELVTGNVVVSEDINALVFATGPTLTHNNFIITGSTLATATAQDYVILSPSPTDSLPDQVNQVAFTVRFKETTNSLGSGDAGASCPSSTLGGSLAWDAVNGCGDIFALGLGELVPTTVNFDETAFLIDTFFRGDYRYDVYLQESTGNIGLLSEAACDAVGASPSPGCVGFVTKENQATRFQLTFAILATERGIPAPGTLFLLGGSLLSLGWFRRRRAAA